MVDNTPIIRTTFKGYPYYKIGNHWGVIKDIPGKNWGSPTDLAIITYDNKVRWIWRYGLEYAYDPTYEVPRLNILGYLDKKKLPYPIENPHYFQKYYFNLKKKAWVNLKDKVSPQKVLEILTTQKEGEPYYLHYDDSLPLESTHKTLPKAVDLCVLFEVL